MHRIGPSLVLLALSIKVAPHPRYLLWTSHKGSLLALSVGHQHVDWPKEGLRLVRFEEWADFGRLIFAIR